MWIVSGSYDKSVWVWDTSTGVELKKLMGHTGLVRSVAFSSNGMWIVSGSLGLHTIPYLTVRRYGHTVTVPSP